MLCSLSDSALTPVADKVAAGARLDFEDGLRLFASRDLIGVGRIADHIRRRRHAERAYYVVNQHLNYTNVCVNRCLFCAFGRDAGDPEAYTLSPQEIARRLSVHPETAFREIHIVGGVNPELDLAYCLELLETVRAVRPEAAIKAFTPVEIDYLARRESCSVEQILQQLKSAGLAMLPGGGAEVISERVWRRLYPNKIDGQRWLEVMETAHGLGLPSNATLLYGHIETAEERVRHLLALRDLQDRTGGFSAFIPLAFHSANTRLAHLPPTDATTDLKTIAAARLLLDNIAHIKAYWVMIGEALAQVALCFGADDLDGTIVEEKITHTAGATSARGLTPPQMRDLIRAAGFDPIERDAFYRPVNVEAEAIEPVGT